MPSTRTQRILLGLALAASLATAPGCGNEPPVVDTAETIRAEPPVVPTPVTAPAPTPTPEAAPAKDAPKG